MNLWKEVWMAIGQQHRLKRVVFFKYMYRIGGVMVSVLASSAVDHEFEHRSGQTKDYEIGICCFSAKHAALRRKSDGNRTTT
jgi:hypothetical protein